MERAPLPGEPKAFEKGRRLHCESCGSEIEIVNPCPCDPPDQVFRCCGVDMRPAVGRPVHVGVE
jgi:hypothetical protein